MLGLAAAVRNSNSSSTTHPPLPPQPHSAHLAPCQQRRSHCAQSWRAGLIAAAWNCGRPAAGDCGACGMSGLSAVDGNCGVAAATHCRRAGAGNPGCNGGVHCTWHGCWGHAGAGRRADPPLLCLGHRGLGCATRQGHCGCHCDSLVLEKGRAWCLG